MQGTPRIRRAEHSIALVLTLVLLATIAGCQGYWARKKEASLLDADLARMQAQTLADEGQLYMVLHTGLTYIHSNGKVDGKDSLTDAILSGRINYRQIDPGERVVGVHGQMGVITGPVHMLVAVGDKERELESVYTAVYWWEGSRWQLATYRSRPIEAPAPAP